MKKIAKVLVIAVIAVVSANSSFAQVTATAQASATIITPITIVKNVDMSFGNVAVSATLGGTVILDQANARTTGGAGGVTLPASTGSVTSASFTVSGQATYTYSISLPSTCTITNPGTQTMIVNNFTSLPASIGTLSGSGSQTLAVGATLNVTAGQAAGIYTNVGGVPVTVNYN
jgi:Domain of unknown function (DUF4402)